MPTEQQPIVNGSIEEQWTTSFTSDNKIVHSFENGYQIIADMETETAYKLKDGEVKEKFSISGMLLETWHQIVINFAKSIK